MNITIECSHCHKRYTAPGTLAGKKVKCKHCAQVFAIPADADPTEEFKAVAEPPAAPGTPAARPAPTANPSAPRGVRAKAGDEYDNKIGDPGKGYAARLQRKDDTPDFDLAGDAPLTDIRRPSVPFDFPGAMAIDSFAPILLAVLGLGLLALMAINSNFSGESWVGPARLAIYVCLFFAVIFPVGLGTINACARKLRFGLPPAAAGRAIGAFALPFGVTMAIWLTGESTGMLIFGTLLGALMACGAVWLLFRLQPQEVTTACATTAGAYAAGVLIAFGILTGVNMAVESSAKGWPQNTLRTSPIGPLSWDVPLHKPEPMPYAVATQPDTNTVENTTTAPGTQPQTQPIDSPPATMQVAIATRPFTAPVDPPPATQVVIEHPATRATQPAPPVNPPPATRTTVVTTRKAPSTEDITPTSPLVAKVQTLAGPSGFESLLPVPGNPNLIGLRKPALDDDTIEIWSLQPLGRKGAVTIPREKTLPSAFAITASGDSVARMVSWPKRAVELWSIAEGKVVRIVPVADSDESSVPRVVEFLATDILLINWMKGDLPDYETINTKGAGQRLAYFNVDPFEPGASNPCFSPDGRLLGVATLVKQKGGIDLYTTTVAMKQPRTCAVGLTQWVKPAGLAFSPDSRQIAAFFHQNGRGYLVSFKVLDTKSSHEHFMAALPAPQEIVESYPANGRALDWLDAQTWLLFGRTLIDVDTGQPLGTLDLDPVRSQRIIDSQTILLITGDGIDRRLVVVKLKPDAIAAARKGLKSRLPARTP